MINIKSIWENQKPTGDIIVKTRIDEIMHLNCFGATNHITGQHLYIMSVSNNILIPDLKNYRFKGVEIFSVEVERNIELTIYLLNNELKDVFSMFIQNILEDIDKSITESEAITVTLNVVSKWKKLFDKIIFNGLSLEQQKGLIGELLFLNFLLSNEKTLRNALNYWTGSEREFETKDFTLGTIGAEIKFTSANQPRLKISNERQLDDENFSELFLVLYSAEAVKENGFSLNSLIEETRQNFRSEDDLNLFNGKLQLHGFFDSDSDQYNRMYSLKNIFTMSITEEFPKITKSQLPIGIYEVSYSIEISAVERFIVNTEQILSNL